MTESTIPIALTIAGSDCSGGAGLQADLKTFAAHGVYGASVVTALTAQNTMGVYGIHGVPPEFIRAQAEAVFGDLDVGAIKVGMLGSAETIEVVASIVEEHSMVPVVVDPVMVTAGGDSLLPSDAVVALRERLLPLALLATPNTHEAALLLGESLADSVEAMEDQAKRLLGLGPAAVLFKGGRRPGTALAVDVFCLRESTEVLESSRIDIRQPQGTGCTLSSAVAAQLASGAPLREAVVAGKRYVSAALERAKDLRIGHGSRPLIH